MALSGIFEKLAYDIFTITIYIWLLYPLKKLLGRAEREELKEENVGGGVSNKVFWFLSFLLGAYFISLKYIILFTVQGYDIPFYIDWGNKILVEGLSWDDFRGLMGRIVSIFLVTFFIYLVGDVYMGIIVLNILLAGLHTSGIFLLGTKLRGQKFGFLAALFTSTSFFFYRLYLDLIANQTAWAFAPYVIYFYIIITMENEVKRYHKLSFATLFLLSMFSHIWSFSILLLALVIHYIFFIRNSQTNTISLGSLKQMLVLLIVSFLVLYAISPMTINGLVRLLLIGWGQGAFRRELFVNRENFLILLLSLVGGYRLSIRMSYKETTVYVLYAIISLFLIAGFLSHPYRLTNLMPWGILSAYGFEELNLRIKNIVFPAFKIKFRNLDFRKIFGAFILLLVLLSAPSPFIKDHVATPSDEALNQLEWVRKKFGYGNESIVVLVNKEVSPRNNLGWSNYYRWINAIIGPRYYSGNILDYLQEMYRVKYSNPITETYYKGITSPEAENKTLLILDKWYDISEIEKNFLKRIGEGIYIVEEKNLTKLIEAIESRSTKLNPGEFYYHIIAPDNYFYVENIEEDAIRIALQTEDNSTPLEIEIPILKLIPYKGRGKIAIEMVSSNNETVIELVTESHEIKSTIYYLKNGKAVYTISVADLEKVFRIKLRIYPAIGKGVTIQLIKILIYR